MTARRHIFIGVICLRIAYTVLMVNILIHPDSNVFKTMIILKMVS